MKHTRLLFSISLALLFCQNASAQTFFKDNTVSFIIKEVQTLKQADECRFKETIRLDSVNLNGEYYTVRVGSNLKDCKSDTTIYKLRTLDRRVYFTGDYNGLAKKDVLIYDFNLLDGDTLEVVLEPGKGTFQSKIDSVRSIVYEDGIARNTQYHSFFKRGNLPIKLNGNIFIAEGLGAQTGIAFFPLNNWPYWRHDLISVCHQDTLMYIWPEYDVKPNIIPINEYCDEDSISYLLGYVETKSINNIPKNQITVYPNPTSEFLQIKGMEQGSFEIYNTHGSLLQSGILEKQISVSDLVPGFYYLLLRNENGVYSGKFVKE